MTSLDGIPQELKSIVPYLSKANEIHSFDPVIAYWCRTHALDLAIKLNVSRAAQASLEPILDQLEQARSSLADNEAITNDVAAQAYVENFGLDVFDKADKEDRAGRANKETSKKFLAAKIFLEVLATFGPLDSEIQAKVKYARWKATDIIKALKAGKVPLAGPAYSSEETAQNVQPDVAMVTEDEIDATVQDVLTQDIDTPDNTRVSTSSADALTGSEALSMKVVADPPTIPARSDSIPSKPADVTPIDLTQPEMPSAPAARTLPSAPMFPTLPTASMPSAPPPAPKPAPRATPARIVAQPVQAGGPTDPKAIGQAQKHAKWAISALDYEDFATARTQLQAALRLITPVTIDLD
ncbi:uncharacterized protein L969DRAFT_97089 [Mixia osmundae IAM 14324]|uniref:Vta1/callose synthase N-terminal domain-containing protein n=1 Tax=Mixia osmundae (strain CBS 9802 / IAM 14324 / JCM 22182 / KY 12970) TaxID=764103 RepID=G7E1N0_MIXOS|nr:uncharacterized protein L969DRAFT_97089 [Mixia osmundae IAM 14324]KEI36690.1 hypothetical protein L969DRAFT_97089 [Mixia osmundae IAM 14324]GAA96740.1 hypothetical protein E5Q_03411 [Mixia osmundae IAM 14324]